ncbi:mitochondrial ubiquitin ligase activator of nfkb 1-A [Engraulis encrasicolus]|uniref:mitochondrial ubiquitin ligase activator of nfkb 1-A n=1 Tax=Engraulis encrasicolus TaxID=184585 RepID=UPI002FD69063
MESPVSTMEAICLGSSMALSGIFYYVYKRKRRTVEKLNDAPQLPLNDQLENLLNQAPGKCLQYVVIEGVVHAAGEPLHSQFQEGSRGVIQKTVLREHKLVWSSLARAWTDSERVLHQRVDSVPFNLVGPDQSTAVRVISPLEATGPEMEVTHEKFHHAGSVGFGDLLGQYLSGEKPKGHLETEEMLKVGSMVTGVGELVIDTDQIVKLRPPTDGQEYFLCTCDLETLRADQEVQAQVWRFMAAACTLAGVAILAWAARRYYRRLREKWEHDRLLREFRSRVPPPRAAGDGAEGGEAGAGAADRPDNMCVICLENPRSCVLLNCGHVCCCHECYRSLPRPNCPICRQNIVRVVPLYQV